MQNGYLQGCNLVEAVMARTVARKLGPHMIKSHAVGIVKPTTRSRWSPLDLKVRIIMERGETSLHNFVHKNPREVYAPHAQRIFLELLAAVNKMHGHGE